MPVKSLITRPAHLFQTLKAEPLEVGGHAWCGEGKVRQVDVTIDYGSTWQRAKLQAPVNPYAWQSWHCALQFPGKGYFEVWARATDEQGRHQPMVVPGWNPKGYLNNAMHRIAYAGHLNATPSKHECTRRPHPMRAILLSCLAESQGHFSIR